MVINPQVQAYSPPAAEVEDDLDARTTLVRMRLLMEYQDMKSASQFVEHFAKMRPAAERAELLKRLSKAKELPKLEIIENGLRLSGETVTLDIDMRSISKRRFLVNGQVFTFSPNHSWLVQSDILMDKLQHPRKSSYSLFSLLVPEAHGVFNPATVMTVIYSVVFMGLVNAAVGHYGNDGLNAFDWEFCEWLVKKRNKGEYPKNPRICKDYKKEVLELAKQNP